MSTTLGPMFSIASRLALGAICGRICKARCAARHRDDIIFIGPAWLSAAAAAAAAVRVVTAKTGEYEMMPVISGQHLHRRTRTAHSFVVKSVSAEPSRACDHRQKNGGLAYMRVCVRAGVRAKRACMSNVVRLRGRQPIVECRVHRQILTWPLGFSAAPHRVCVRLPVLAVNMYTTRTHVCVCVCYA